MGFEDEVLSKAALEQVGGNVNLAIEKIISGSILVPAPPKDDARTTPAGLAFLGGCGGGQGAASAAGGGTGAHKGGSGGGVIASIFNLSQRSVVHPAGAVAGVGGQKPRTRPTAATSKQARPLVRSVTSCNSSSGLAQASLGMLPIKRDRFDMVGARTVVGVERVAKGVVSTVGCERRCPTQDSEVVPSITYYSGFPSTIQSLCYPCFHLQATRHLSNRVPAHAAWRETRFIYLLKQS